MDDLLFEAAIELGNVHNDLPDLSSDGAPVEAATIGTLELLVESAQNRVELTDVILGTLNDALSVELEMTIPVHIGSANRNAEAVSDLGQADPFGVLISNALHPVEDLRILSPGQGLEMA